MTDRPDFRRKFRKSGRFSRYLAESEGYIVIANQ